MKTRMVAVVLLAAAGALVRAEATLAQDFGGLGALFGYEYPERYQAPAPRAYHRPSRPYQDEGWYAPLRARTKAARIERQRSKPIRVTAVPAQAKSEVLPPPTMPLRAKPIGQKTNPIPVLLADKTLRKGDIVVFPDGPRVFQGKEYGGHVLSDFVKLSNTKVASSARKLFESAKVGENDAWDESAEQVQTKDGKKVAATRRASQPD